MRDQKRLNMPYQLMVIAIFMQLFLIACGSAPIRKNPSLDLANVDKMIFTIEGNTPFLGINLPVANINKQVTDNLSAWNYQFANQGTTQHTHDLSISIGAMHYDATPAGFSFSSGNSDPRALDFQKATTIPLTCALMPKNNHQQRAELVMEVMAEEYTGTPVLSVTKEKIISRLTDDISTTCFNLLSHLNIKTKTDESTPSAITPSWIPKIRVEIESIPAKENSHTTKSTLAVPSNNSQQKKRIIIHNQGTPVIFKFGPDR